MQIHVIGVNIILTGIIIGHGNPERTAADLRRLLIVIPNGDGLVEKPIAHPTVRASIRGTIQIDIIGKDIIVSRPKAGYCRGKSMIVTIQASPCRRSYIHIPNNNAAFYCQRRIVTKMVQLRHCSTLI
jgi:hypothetical protein